MSKLTLEYTEKKHTLEVDKKEYEIPKRTVKITRALKAHDERLLEADEYESNMEVLKILFGKESVKVMFPEEEDTNLDKLLACTKLALAAFYADFNEIKKEEMPIKAAEKKQNKR